MNIALKILSKLETILIKLSSHRIDCEPKWLPTMNIAIRRRNVKFERFRANKSSFES